jgi:hypothetical protein
MKTAKIDLKFDGVTPCVIGNYEFELGKNTTVVNNLPVKEIKFNWCVEIPQNLLSKASEKKCYKLLAKQLKKDFIKFLNSKPIEDNI